jgi:hypothetical protein
MNTKRITALILTPFLALLILVTPVLAGVPRFNKANASGPDKDGNLKVSFTASVYKNHGAYVSTHATREATYACKPADGNFLPNPIYEIVSDEFEYGTGFQAKGGSINGVFAIPPPAASITCGEGMVVALAMVTYSNVGVIGWMEGGEWPFFKNIPGTFSATYYGYTP